MATEIKRWIDIEDQFTDGLILGNGARRSADNALTFALITSARKGFTSTVVASIDNNCAVIALVPEPPKGSAMCLGRYPRESIAALTKEGENASLK